MPCQTLGDLTDHSSETQKARVNGRPPQTLQLTSVLPNQEQPPHPQWTPACSTSQAGLSLAISSSLQRKPPKPARPMQSLLGRELPTWSYLVTIVSLAYKEVLGRPAKLTWCLHWLLSLYSVCSCWDSSQVESCNCFGLS